MDRSRQFPLSCWTTRFLTLCLQRQRCGILRWGGCAQWRCRDRSQQQRTAWLQEGCDWRKEHGATCDGSLAWPHDFVYCLSHLGYFAEPCFCPVYIHFLSYFTGPRIVHTFSYTKQAAEAGKSQVGQRINKNHQKVEYKQEPNGKNMETIQEKPNK